MPHHRAGNLKPVHRGHGAGAEILAVDHRVGGHFAAEAQPEHAGEQVKSPHLAHRTGEQQNRHRAGLYPQRQRHYGLAANALRDYRHHKTPDDAEQVDQRQNPGGGSELNAAVDGVVHHENEDDAVPGAAHAMNDGQAPESPGMLHLPLEHPQTQPGRRRVKAHRRRVARRRAVGQQPFLRRLVAEKGQQTQRNAAAGNADGNEGSRPAVVFQQLGIDRSQGRRAHAAGRPHYADAQPQPPLEPGVHRRHQRHDGDGRSQRQHHAVHQKELPHLGQVANQRHAHAEQDAPGQQQLARPQDVPQSPAVRRGQRTHQVVARQGHSNDGGRPAEPAAIRQRRPQLRHHNAGGHRDGLPENLHHRKDGDDDPGVMKTTGVPGAGAANWR